MRSTSEPLLPSPGRAVSNGAGLGLGLGAEDADLMGGGGGGGGMHAAGGPPVTPVSSNYLGDGSRLGFLHSGGGVPHNPHRPPPPLSAPPLGAGDGWVSGGGRVMGNTLSPHSGGLPPASFVSGLPPSDGKSGSDGDILEFLTFQVGYGRVFVCMSVVFWNLFHGDRGRGGGSFWLLFYAIKVNLSLFRFSKSSVCGFHMLLEKVC